MRRATIASITMMPSEVVMAHAEYSLWPTKYRLSNTFTGSACHVFGSFATDGGAGVVLITIVGRM
jgi:hypothetical protein